MATVERERKGRLRLAYTDAAHDAFDGGTPLLSLDLPLTRQSHSNARTRAFLDGLLPEGEPRRAIAEQFDILASDVFGLLEILGRDCAGALADLLDRLPVAITEAAAQIPGVPGALVELVCSRTEQLTASGPHVRSGGPVETHVLPRKGRVSP